MERGLQSFNQPVLWMQLPVSKKESSGENPRSMSFEILLEIVRGGLID